MAAKKPTKSATPTTVTLKHLAAAIAENHEMPKKQSEAILGDMVALVVKHLKKGERIRIGGLGILVVRKRAAGVPRRQRAQGSRLSCRRPPHRGPDGFRRSGWYASPICPIFRLVERRIVTHGP